MLHNQHLGGKRKNFAYVREMGRHSLQGISGGLSALYHREITAESSLLIHGKMTVECKLHVC